MDMEGAEVLQLLIPNFNLKNIVSKSFLKDIQDKYDGNVKIVSLNIAIGEERSEIITLSHLTPHYEKENKLVLDTRNPENIDIMLKIIKKYQNEG